MAKRRRMSSSGSKRLFSRTANRVHPMNGLTGAGGPMRGGIRL